MGGVGQVRSSACVLGVGVVRVLAADDAAAAVQGRRAEREGEALVDALDKVSAFDEVTKLGP